MGAERKPLARTGDLIVEELGDELLIYDLGTDNVHSLAPAAARVWRGCDGNTEPAELSLAVGVEHAEVERALGELDDAGLLATTPLLVRSNGMSRRDFGLRLSKVAAATAVVPLVLSVPAPAIGQGESIEEICEAIQNANGCGKCNAGGVAGGLCCCCEAGGGNIKRCAASESHCKELLGANASCTESGGEDTPRLQTENDGRISTENADSSVPSTSQAPTSTEPPVSTAPESVAPPPSEAAPAAPPVETAPPTAPVEPSPAPVAPAPTEPVVPSAAETTSTTATP